MKKTASFSSNEGDTSASDSVVSDCSSLNLSSEEMQDVQAAFNSDFDHDSSQSILENDESCNGEGPSTKHRANRKEKVKEKIKKLVPKKLRRSMKKRSGSKPEDPGPEEEFNFDLKENKTEHDDVKEDISVAATDSYQSMISDSEESVVEAEPQRATDRRTLVLEYWLVSFIVLAGLVEGQSLAIVLTVAWCLIVKLVGRMRMKKWKAF
ncbi:hypothetical protein ACET3Z_005619 [Daucus carota]